MSPESFAEDFSLVLFCTMDLAHPGVLMAQARSYPGFRHSLCGSSDGMFKRAKPIPFCGGIPSRFHEDPSWVWELLG